MPTPVLTRRRDWYPALPEIHAKGQTLNALGLRPNSGAKVVSNVHMLGIGKNPGSMPTGPNNRGTIIRDSILEPDPSTFDPKVGDVFWLERRFRCGDDLREGVIYRGNALPMSHPDFHLKSNHEQADYGNDEGPQTWRRCVFLAIAAHPLQRVTANTKPKQDAKTGRWYAERKDEMATKAEKLAGDFGAYWNALKQSGTHLVDACVSAECGLAIGIGRASYGYSFFPAPFDVHIKGGSYTTVNAPGHDTSDSSPDLDANSFGGLLVECRTNFVDVDPLTGRGIGGPKGDGVMIFKRSVLVEDWHLELYKPDRDVVRIADSIAPIEFVGGRYMGGAFEFERCSGGISFKGVEGDTRIRVDGKDVGRIDSNYSKAAA